MKRKVQSIDYVTKDYEGFRQMMIDLIPKYTPEWTDTSESDMGIVLIELLANGLDVLSFYQDKIFNESFLTTAKTRKSVINLARLLTYELSQQKPASHRLKFTKSKNYSEETIKIPKGFKVSTKSEDDSPIVFELEEDVTLMANGLGEAVEAWGLVTQGVTVEEDILGVASSIEGEKFTLNYPDVLFDTLVVITEESNVSRRWTRVLDFLSSKADDRHYIATTDEYNVTTLEFGGGQAGMRIPKNSIVSAGYRVGGGIIGNVGLNTITETVDKEIAGVEFTNPEPVFEKGTDIEDIEHAKIVAPKAYRSVGRAVTALDFEDILMQKSGVEKVKCVETFNANGDVLLYVVPTDFTLPSEGLKQELLSYINEVKLIHENPIILDPIYVDYNINVNVIAYDNYLNDEIKAKVEDRLYEVFDLRYMEFGEDINIATIYKEIMTIEGIRNASIVLPLNDLSIEGAQIARLVAVNATVSGGVDK